MFLNLHQVVLSQLTLYLTLLIRALFIYLATRSSQVEFCEWVCVTVQYQVSLSPGVTCAMMFCFDLFFLSSQEKKWAKRPWVWTQPVVTAISGRFGLILAFPASFSPSFLPSFLSPGFVELCRVWWMLWEKLSKRNEEQSIVQLSKLL